MRIIIVKSNTKAGVRYKAYYPGLLSFFGIYCALNYVPWTGASTVDECVEQAQEEMRPAPKANKQRICKVEI